MRATPGRAQWTLRQARLLGARVRPGGLARVECRLERWRGASETRVLDLRVPEELPEGAYRVWVGGGTELTPSRRRPGARALPSHVARRRLASLRRAAARHHAACGRPRRGQRRHDRRAGLPRPATLGRRPALERADRGRGGPPFRRLLRGGGRASPGRRGPGRAAAQPHRRFESSVSLGGPVHDSPPRAAARRLLPFACPARPAGPGRSGGGHAVVDPRYARRPREVGSARDRGAPGWLA